MSYHIHSPPLAFDLFSCWQGQVDVPPICLFRPTRQFLATRSPDFVTWLRKAIEQLKAG
jgi:hypothetical protein